MGSKPVGTKRPRFYPGRGPVQAETNTPAPGAAERCPACVEGPAGIEGHDRLFAGTVAGDQLGFVCADCGQQWSRRYHGEGLFDWTALGSPPSGVALPGRRPPES